MNAITISAPNEHAVMMLTRWLVAEGAKVAKDTALCDVEIAWVYEPRVRDALVQIKSPIDGSIERIAKEGEVLGAGQAICRITPIG